jgi:hypothetical protein
MWKKLAADVGLFAVRVIAHKTGRVALTTLAATSIAWANGTITTEVAVPTLSLNVLGILLRDGKAKEQQERGE